MPEDVRRGLAGGAVAGIVTVAGMYLANALLGTKTLPQLLQGPLLGHLPGPLFGFLIDRLQHLGKVVEEAGIILSLIAAGAAAGALYARLERRTRHSAWIVGAAGFLVVGLVVLPLTGDGLFGFAEGLLGPAVWALLAVVFTTVLQLAAGPLDSPADAGRRGALGALPLGLGAVGLAVLAARLGPEWFASVVHPPEAGVHGPAPEVTPVRDFYVVSKNFSDPVVAAAGWTLRVHGLVDRELKLSYDELRQRPAVSEYVTYECISNNVGGNLISTGLFTGTRLRDLLQEAGPQPGARFVGYTSADGYTESYPLAAALATPELLVAWDLDGAPLPDLHGFPARIVLPGHYGMKQPKWLQSIALLDQDPGGFWEAQGWDAGARVRTMSRFDYPQDGYLLRRRHLQLAGVAFAGTRGIRRVEVSTDGARTWQDADLRPPLSGFAWTLWTLPWTPPRQGFYTLSVRATDGTGALQSEQQEPSFPSGAAGWDTIQVTVSQ